MNCLDEGLLQALLDGELSAERRRESEAHLASCATCAAAAREAAREFALFSQAFAVEGPSNVPTERLRASVASAIAGMQPARSADRTAARESSGRPRSFWSSLAAALAPRPAAVFASLALAAVVLAATYLALRPGPRPVNNEQPEIAKGPGGPTPITVGLAAPAASPTAEQPGLQPASAQTSRMAKGIGPKIVRPEREKIRPRGTAGEMAKFRPKNPGTELAKIEREYVQEIAALSSSIERQKLQTLSPTLRAEYERNVAVVDGAIAATREAARSNPKDRDAQEFLRTAYQDKIDLLSAFAGKSQLASADR